MKRSLHLIMSALVLIALSSNANAQTVIYSQDFETATSADDWTIAGDSKSEATVARSADGGTSSSAALLLTGTNSDGDGGRGFVFESGVASSLDYAGLTDVTLKFDLKLNSALVGTALHLRTDFGGGLVETFDLQALQTLTTDSYTSYAIDFTGVPGDASTFKIGFTLAVGAEVDFGGSVFVDNISLEEQDGSGGGSGDELNSPVTFETGEFGDGWTWTVFENNDNPAIEVIDNPDPTGANTSAKVAKFTARSAASGAASFAGAKTDDIGKFTLDANNSTVKMMVWKSKISDVGFKFEKSDGASTGEIKVANTVTDQWEELTFDFSAVVGNGANSDIEFITIFPDFADDREENIIYFDNIQIGDGSGGGGGGGSSGAIVVAEPFDATTSVDDWTGIADAASGSESSISWNDGGGNPGGALQLTGTNPSDAAGKAYIFEKTFSSLDYDGASDVTLTFDLKLSSALIASAVHLRTEIPGVGFNENLDLQNSGLNETTWTSYSYTFSGVENAASTFKIGFQFAAGAVVDAGGTLLVDNIIVTTGDGSGGGDEELVVNGDFESGSTPWSGNAVDVRTEGGNSYNFADVATAGNAFDVNLSQVLPLVEGTNYVMKFDASTSTGNTRTMIAGIGLNEGAFTSNTQTVNLTDQSQTFTLNLSATGFGGANCRVLFDMGADVGIVVIDNVSLKVDNGGGEESDISLPVTFEDDMINYELEDFGGNASEIVVDPTDANNKVVQSTKGTGSATSEVWAGTTVANVSGFGAIPFDETNTSMTVRVWSPTAGIPVRLKVEDKSNGGVSVETEATTTVAEEWETLTFDFSNQADGTAALNIANTYDKASIFFNFGTGGTGQVYYWDDVSFYEASSDATLSDLQVDGTTITGFDAGTTTYTYEVSDQVTTVPTVSATATSSAASVAVVQADDLPGTATVTVTAEDASTQVYTVNFVVVSSVSSLSDLQVGGTTITGFDAGTFAYAYELARDASDVPDVTATATDDGATVEVTQAATLTGTATVLVTAEDGTTTSEYTVTFSLALGLGDELNDLAIYPNPSSDRIELTLPDGMSKPEVRIVDFNGRISRPAFEQEGDDLTIDIQSLAKGIYFLQVSENDTTVTNKFIKK